MLTPDQIAAAQKANLDTLFGLMRKTLEGVEKLTELNMSTMKQSLGDSARRVDATLSAKDAQELLALQSAMLQPLMEKTAAYTRALYELAQASGTDMARAVEERTTELQRAVDALMSASLSSAPAGTETAVAAMRNAMGAANEALESMNKAFRQAGAMAEQNFKAVATHASDAVHQATQAAGASPARAASKAAAKPAPRKR